MSIICKKITKQFGSTNVLKGIDMKIESGEYIAIMGKSGAGKSTLINIMAGIERPTSGQVIYNNIDLYNCNETELAKYRLHDFGFIFQFYNLIPELTLFENIVLPFEIGNEKVNILDADKLIDRLALSHRKNNLPSTLSGGEQQRAAIARAIILNPKIIFADEPTGNLDDENATSFLELIKEVRNLLNSTIIIVTHDISIAKNADRILYISDGEISEQAG